MSGKALLEIKDLQAKVEDTQILRGINLTLRPGEVHAIMGPNGSGKSTLANVLAGRPDYTVTGGSVTYEGKDLLALSPEDRAREGVFLAFQYPVEIPGVSNSYFLRTALNAVRVHRGQDPIDAIDFLKLLKEKMKFVEMDPKFQNRAVNEGFSGGEKKRNEILQMAILEPTLAILDETDSGLDIDALRIVAEGVNALRKEDHAVLVVTHYQRLLDYLVPDFVMANDPDRSTLRAFGPGAPEPDLWLVYDPCVPADIVESFAGHRLAAESGAALSQWLARNHLAHGSLGTVLSVAHAAYQFARHLGCTPIILTGQDLAFDRTRMHCSGSFYDQFHCDRVNERLPVQSLEQQKFEGYAESLGTLSDVFGQPAATTLALDAYRNRFAEVIGGAADVINATEGGIPIPGVENRTLREALHRHCRGTVGERKKRFRDQIAAPPCPDALLAANHPTRVTTG